MNAEKITISSSPIVHSSLSKMFFVGLLASSLVVGCKSVEPKPNENPEPVAQASEAVAPVETVAESKQNSKSADALMATLVAPIEEPVVDEKPIVITKEVKKQVKKVVKSIKEAAPEKTLAPAKVEKVVSKAKTIKTDVVKKVVVKTAAIKKKVTTRRALSAKPLSIRKKDLPKTYDIWQFKEGVAALEKGIVVSTPTWEMGQEGYMSQIWLTLMEDQILVNSSSDIDQSAGPVGIKINGGELIPFSRIEDNNIAVLEGEWLDELKVGGTMDIFLGFFPGKRPQSKVFKTDVSLDSLSRVIPTYRKLLK